MHSQKKNDLSGMEVTNLARPQRNVFGENILVICNSLKVQVVNG
jgi:hypothetical protein